MRRLDGCWGALGFALLLGLQAASPLQAAPKPKPAATAPAADELQRAQSELDTFNGKTNNAAGSDAEASLALRSAELQLKVVEATTLPRVKSSAQLEQNMARLADVKTKLVQAKKPKAGSAPAPAATLAALEQRRSTAHDAALLLQASYLLEFSALVEDGAVEALYRARPDSQGSIIKRNLGQVQSSAAKAEAKRLNELAKGWPKSHWLMLGQMTFESITSDNTDACRKLGRDELAWDLLTLQSATQIAMTKVPPNSVVAERMPHHDATTAAEVARDVKRALYGSVLQAAVALEATKGCAARAAAPRAPAGAGGLVRTVLIAASATEPLEELVTHTGYGIPEPLNQRAPAATGAKSHRAELDKRAQSGASALTRYQGALKRSKDGKVDPKDLVLARDELTAAKAAAVNAAKMRTLVRKHEDEMMGALVEADKAVAGAKEGMKAAREAQKSLSTLLAQYGRDAGTDATKKAAAARANAIAKRVPDVIAYADGRIAEARAAVQKHVTKAALGTVADYPKRLAQAQKDDAAIALRSQTVEAQLKEVTSLLQQDSARCENLE